MRSAMVRLLLPACISLLAGCGPKVDLVAPGRVVRLAEDAQAKIWVPDGRGGYIESRNAVKLPAGGYYAPPPTSQPTTQP